MISMDDATKNRWFFYVLRIYVVRFICDRHLVYRDIYINLPYYFALIVYDSPNFGYVKKYVTYV